MIAERLYGAFMEPARSRSVAGVTIGLAYTAVSLDDGCLGLCYTMIDRRACCTQVRAFRDFDGLPASDLLEYARSDDTLERSMGLALVNALNEERAADMPRDVGPRTGVIAQLGIGSGTRVAMVGYFPPVAARITAAGAELSILDRDRGLGDRTQFMDALATWPDVLILTATSLLDDSCTPFLQHVGDGARVALMGPSTPMVPEVYADLPVHMLAGMVPLNRDRVLAVVRQGGGTPALGPHSQKVYWLRPDTMEVRDA